MRLRLPRAAVALVAVAMVAAACGARLTDEQRNAAIGGLAGGAGTTGTTGTTTETTGGATVLTTGGTTTGTATGSALTTTTTGGALPQDCAGGGATDTGVTEDSITVATIANISGIQPGLFKSVHQAMDALAAYVNAPIEQGGLGGICGRTLKILKIDDKTESVGNRSATLDACKNAFALVGSMSAFDDGGADVVDSCGIPDMTAIPVNPPRAFAKSTYGIYPNRPDLILGGPARWTAERNPGVEQNAAMLYLDAGVTRVNALQRVKAYEKIGWRFVYKQAIQLVETNYTPYVLAMKNHDPPVKYVSMVSDYQSIVRVLKAMRQQNWYPEVLDWDSVVYSPGFIKLGGEAIAHSQFFMNTAMIEEIQANPEMALYQYWLGQVAQGAPIDYFGLYAWSAGRLFAQLAAGIGPELKREKLFQALRKVHAWGGNGLHAEHDVGNHLASKCFLYAKVENGVFVRVAPKAGWMCNEGGLVEVSV